MITEYSRALPFGGLWQRTVVALVLASSVLLSSPARANQAGDDATRSAARVLGYEGLGAYNAGDYPRAEEKLAKAFTAVKVPTQALWLGRALAKGGKLVESSERYAEATRLTLSQGAIGAHKAAQREVGEELEALEPRLSRRAYHHRGNETQGSPGESRRCRGSNGTDCCETTHQPRTRMISGKFRHEPVNRQILIAEGQTETVVLHSGQSSRAQQAAMTDRQASTHGQRTGASQVQCVAGWIALGVGAVGVVAGTATGMTAFVRENAVSSECPDDNCPPRRHDDADTVNSLRCVPTSGFIIGAIGVGTGLALLLTSPGGSRERAAQHNSNRG